MPEPYTIRIFVQDGDPQGVKIVDLLNWTGLVICFPRSEWPRVCKRAEFDRCGVYVLTGTAEGVDDELPTLYIGQGDEIRSRIDSHVVKKDFWTWGFVFVSRDNSLNRMHSAWLEHALVDRALTMKRCHLDNGNQPREPNLSEAERADTRGFLREILRILPLLGISVFEPPTPVATPGRIAPKGPTSSEAVLTPPDDRDTVVVPAREGGFQRVFLGENCWYAIRIGGGMLPRIKYIAAYRTAPVSAITHYAPVERIEPYGDEGKYQLVFASPARPMPHPIPLGDAVPGTMQGSRYTNLERLLRAKAVPDLFG